MWRSHVCVIAYTSTLSYTDKVLQLAGRAPTMHKLTAKSSSHIQIHRYMRDLHSYTGPSPLCNTQSLAPPPQITMFTDAKAVVGTVGRRKLPNAKIQSTHKRSMSIHIKAHALHTSTHIRTHIRTHTHTYAHTYTHTHTQRKIAQRAHPDKPPQCTHSVPTTLEHTYKKRMLQSIVSVYVHRQTECHTDTYICTGHVHA